MDPIAEMFALSGWMSALLDGVMVTISSIFNEVFEMMSFSFMFEIIAIIIIIGKCIFLAFSFAVKAFIWFFTGFIPWLFTPWPNDFVSPRVGDEHIQAGLLPYVIRYIIVIALGIINIPKCILWYGLDTLGWIIYLPFRLAFWTLDYFLNMGMTDKEHQAWNFLDEIDYFLHGPVGNWFNYQYEGLGNTNIPDPNTLNLGLHFIHFPDSVMRTCYSISPYSLAACNGASEVMDAFTAFIACATNPF